MSTTLAAGCTSKATFRTLIVEAMNAVRAAGEEPTWASVCKFVQKSGVLRAGDMKYNHTMTAHAGFEHVWQTTMSFVASDMKKEGELVREPGYPWILTAWGITGVDLAHEIHKRKVVVSTCTKCFCQHRPEVDCY